jgi:hypothetical protein
MSVPVAYNLAQAITRSDTVDIALPGSADAVDAIYVGGAGNIVLVYPNNDTVTVTGVLAGTIYPLGGFKRVNLTNTTATPLLALYRI